MPEIRPEFEVSGDCKTCDHGFNHGLDECRVFDENYSDGRLPKCIAAEVTSESERDIDLETVIYHLRKRLQKADSKIMLLKEKAAEAIEDKCCGTCRFWGDESDVFDDFRPCNIKLPLGTRRGMLEKTAGKDCDAWKARIKDA